MIRRSLGGQKNIQRTDREDMRVYRLSKTARIGVNEALLGAYYVDASSAETDDLRRTSVWSEARFGFPREKKPAER